MAVIQPYHPPGVTNAPELSAEAGLTILPGQVVRSSQTAKQRLLAPTMSSSARAARQPLRSQSTNQLNSFISNVPTRNSSTPRVVLKKGWAKLPKKLIEPIPDKAAVKGPMKNPLTSSHGNVRSTLQIKQKVAKRKADRISVELPFDLLKVICRQLDPDDDRKTLHAIMMTCWEGYKAVVPVLYSVLGMKSAHLRTPLLPPAKSCRCPEHRCSPPYCKFRYQSSMRLAIAFSSARILPINSYKDRSHHVLQHTLYDLGIVHHHHEILSIQTLTQFAGFRLPYPRLVDASRGEKVELWKLLPAIHTIKISANFLNEIVQELPASRLQPTDRKRIQVSIRPEEIKIGEVTTLCIRPPTRPLIHRPQSIFDHRLSINHTVTVIDLCWTQLIQREYRLRSQVNIHLPNLDYFLVYSVPGARNVFRLPAPSMQIRSEPVNALPLIFPFIVTQIKRNLTTTWEIIGLVELCKPGGTKYAHRRLQAEIEKKVYDRLVEEAKKVKNSQLPRKEACVARLLNARTNGLIKFTLRIDAEPCPGCPREQ